MSSTAKPEDLKKAYKKEKDPRVKIRMAAVNMVAIRGKSLQETADNLMQCPNWVSYWVERFREGGLDALRDLPRRGRTPKVAPEKIAGLVAGIGSITTPRQLKEDIRGRLNVTYHITSVRRIMRYLGMSAKFPQRVHENKARQEEIRRWQRGAKRRISRLKRQGFATVILDESFFIHDPATGRKYWSPRGEPIAMEYNGRHRKVVVYGAIATDGRRFFRTRDCFDSGTFLSYLKELQRHFGRVHVIMDSASPRTSRVVVESVLDDCNIKTLYLPTATPELSAIEEYWRQSKRNILVSEYYATFEKMRHALSEYLRTSHTDLDVMKYVGRKSLTLKNF